MRDFGSLYFRIRHTFVTTSFYSKSSILKLYYRKHKVLHTVRSLLNGKSFLLTHCPQIYIRKEISRPGFLDVSRYSFQNSIDLRRVFLRYINISMCKFGDSVSCPGLYGGLYGQNLPYKFKYSYYTYIPGACQLAAERSVQKSIRFKDAFGYLLVVDVTMLDGQ
jgi:hypothetical protein